MTGDLTLAHLSDTHVGYEAYKARSARGENQRAVDIVRAFVAAVDDIIAADPPLVIHSGDVADRTVVPIRLLLLIRQQFGRLAEIRPDGSRRQVVIVAGNHELPRHRKEACLLDLLGGMPGVHPVTRGYTRVTFDGAGASAGRHQSLDDVVVHAIPHDDLKYTDFDTVVPIDGAINILSSHGVAGGSELYVRSLGREFAIPTDVVARDWDYGALGHWHKRGPVGITTALAETGRVWYAGSTENMGFGDLKDDGTERGWLHVTIRPGDVPDVERRNVPIRRMVRLPAVDAAGTSLDDIVDAAIANLRAVETAGAILSQRIVNLPRERWAVLPTERIRAAAGNALHLDIRPTAPDTDGATAASAGRTHDGTPADIDRTLEQVAEEILDPSEREGGLRLARHLIGQETQRRSGERGRREGSAAEAVDA